MDENLKREIILDNYQNPENKELIDDDSYLKVNQASESCTSASSIMSRALIGKSVDEAKKILINYKNMIEDKEYDKELLGELIVYDNINKQPNRIKCALLPEEAIDKMLGGLENE